MEYWYFIIIGICGLALWGGPKPTTSRADAAAMPAPPPDPDLHRHGVAFFDKFNRWPDLTRSDDRAALEILAAPRPAPAVPFTPIFIDARDAEHGQRLFTTATGRDPQSRSDWEAVARLVAATKPAPVRMTAIPEAPPAMAPRMAPPDPHGWANDWRASA